MDRPAEYVSKPVWHTVSIHVLSTMEGAQRVQHVVKHKTRVLLVNAVHQ